MQRFATPLIWVAAALLLFWYFKPIFWPTYDTDDPDYNWLSTSLGGRDIDLARLNGGNWQTACLFGGYTDPVAEIKRIGMSVRVGDIARFWRYRGLPIRLGAVEEDEAAVAFADNNGVTHFILLPYRAIDLQYFRRCIKKPETLLNLT